MKTHPNTQAVIDAWRRLANGESGADGPEAGDFPGLVGRLFVLSRVDDGDYPFQRAGYALERLLGRALPDHNFLNLWNEPDRQLVRAALYSALADNGPTIIHARGETLTGRQIDMEISLAPLAGKQGASSRMLGLCQTMSPEDMLGGRPLRRLQTVAVYPPAPPARHAAIRIVSSR